MSEQRHGERQADIARLRGEIVRKQRERERERAREREIDREGETEGDRDRVR